MATQAERLAALEEENALQKAQIEVLEGKLILVLDYLDQRVVDRLNKMEWNLNRHAISGYTLKQVTNMVCNEIQRPSFIQGVEHTLSGFHDSIDTALSYDPPVPTRNELEAQIVSPPTTPAPEEPEA